jgi:hypothetical protein
MAVTLDSLESYIGIDSTLERVQDSAQNLQNNFFKLFYFAYKSCNLEQKFERSRVTYYGHMLYMIVYMIQLTSLTIPTPQIQRKENLEDFYYVLSMFRIDFMGIYFEVGNVLYWLVVSLTSILALSFLRLYISLMKDISPSPRLYRLILFHPLYFIKHFAFIPCLSVLLSVYKYSSNSL